MMQGAAEHAAGQRAPTAFSLALRVSACERCGAPLTIGPAETAQRCGFCQADNRVQLRAHTQVASTPARSFANAQEHRAHLAQQVREPAVARERLPALAAWELAEATAAWNAARLKARQYGAPQENEQCLARALQLAEAHLRAGDPFRARAILETTTEELTLPRCKQVARAELARFAARLGDHEAAMSWLRSCEAGSEMLETDSVVRVAHAAIELGRGNWKTVLDVLSPGGWAWPIHHTLRYEAMLYRAHAWESLGELPRAVGALLRGPGLPPPDWDALERTRASLASPWPSGPEARARAPWHRVLHEAMTRIAARPNANTQKVLGFFGKGSAGILMMVASIFYEDKFGRPFTDWALLALGMLVAAGIVAAVWRGSAAAAQARVKRALDGSLRDRAVAHSTQSGLYGPQLELKIDGMPRQRFGVEHAPLPDGMIVDVARDPQSSFYMPVAVPVIHDHA